VERPGPLRWLWYAVGGGLPPAHRQWVLHDLTVRTWWLRQLFRSIVQILPVAVLILLFLPGPTWVPVMAILGGTAVGLLYAAAYLEESTEHRALKAGFARGIAKAVRDQADAGTREAAAARYAQRYRGGPPPTRRSSE
jgi:hypothetical protein